MTRSLPSEAAIQAQILIHVTALPDAMFERCNTGTGRTDTGRMVRFGTPGGPDIRGTWCGRAIAIEVKSAIGRQSREQKLWQAQFERAGGLYVLARSVDDVRAALLPMQVAA